jgi:DNA-binding Lrp family transcriptional regulator
VLNYVRDRGPISRAEIARRTKLQRSTISEIVDSLLEEGLVEEVGSGQSTGGRCPTLLALRTTGAAAIGIDIAPTRTTVATSDLAGGLLESEEFETDHDFERTLRVKSSRPTTTSSARSRARSPPLRGSKRGAADVSKASA